MTRTKSRVHELLCCSTIENIHYGLLSHSGGCAPLHISQCSNRQNSHNITSNNFIFIMLKREDCNEEERVLEDDPEYRSVMIKGLRAPTMPIPLAPLPTLSDSSIKTLDRKSGISKLNRSSSLSLRWKVFELSELPHDYMLVRTNVYIKDSRPQEIADKIYNALRSLSISIDPRVVKEEVISCYSPFYYLINSLKTTIYFNSLIVVVPSSPFFDTKEFPRRRNTTGHQTYYQSL
mmetsp:Transcript_9834/g.20858  ORF Transcript_9834/g.20858 Transcript_9834/m.20858 type:complete len:234 (+) Transcript_9834:61-762(+)